MTDPELTPAAGDTPGPFATPVQDADVRALLGTLRAEDVPMPDDVVRRINAAVVAERVASTLPDSPAALVDADDSAAAAGSAAAGSATVTVLPSASQRRGPSYAGLTRILAVAAAVVVVVGLGAILKNSGGLSSGASTAGAASSAPEDSSAGGVVKASGRDYTATALRSQVTGLVLGKVETTTAQSGSTRAATPAPAASGTPGGSEGSFYGLADADVLARCVTSITGGTAVAPVAVDQGTYGGKPAEILVLPTEGDASSLDVWVVAPGCGTGPEPTVLEFQRIARP